MLYYLIAGIILIIGVIIKLLTSRNYFNKYKYVRVVEYDENMKISIRYIKHQHFNKDNAILINPKHVYNYKGYTTIVKTNLANESINPIDFESKYPADKYKSAIKSKVIADTFATLKVEKFDKLMFLLLLNAIQLIAIIYLLYMGMEKGGI